MEMSINPGIVKIALRLRADQCTLVPEHRAELTTEGGLDVVRDRRRIKPVVARLKEASIITSAFIEPREEQIAAAAECGFQAIELWTADYANAKTERGRTKALQALMRGIETGLDHGLTVHGGHGLTYRNIGPVADLGGFEEFNIGHSIVARAMFIGLREAVREMKRLLDGAAARIAIIDSEPGQL